MSAPVEGQDIFAVPESAHQYQGFFNSDDVNDMAMLRNSFAKHRHAELKQPIHQQRCAAEGMNNAVAKLMQSSDEAGKAGQASPDPQQYLGMQILNTSLELFDAEVPSKMIKVLASVESIQKLGLKDNFKMQDFEPHRKEISLAWDMASSNGVTSEMLFGFKLKGVFFA